MDRILWKPTLYAFFSERELARLSSWTTTYPKAYECVYASNCCDAHFDQVMYDLCYV